MLSLLKAGSWRTTAFDISLGMHVSFEGICTNICDAARCDGSIRMESSSASGVSGKENSICMHTGDISINLDITSKVELAENLAQAVPKEKAKRTTQKIQDGTLEPDPSFTSSRMRGIPN